MTGETTTGQPLSTGLYPAIPQAPQFPPFSPAPQDTGARIGIDNVSPGVPLAPLPDQPAMQPNAPFVPIAPNAPAETTPFVTASNVTNSTIQPTTIQDTNVPNTTTGVPLAPFPNDSTSQAQLKGGAATFVIYNISMYTIISLLIATTIF